MDKGLSFYKVLGKLGFQRYWVVWALCAVAAVSDFSLRFLPDYMSEKPLSQAEAPQRWSAIAVLGGDLLEAYTLKLGKFSELEEAGVEEVLVIEPADTPPNLGFWQGSDYSYQLLAIFKGSDTFAVLSRTAIESTDKDVVELRAGELADGFSVSSIDGNSVVLAGFDEERVELKLFRSAADFLDEAKLQVEP